MEKYKVKVNGLEYIIEFCDTSDLNKIKEIYINNEKYEIDIDLDKLDSIVVNNNTHKINGLYDYDGEIVKLLIGKDYHNIEVEEFKPIKKDKLKDKECKIRENQIKAPMPGKIISISVDIGQCIKKGQDLLVLEAMKMENRITSPSDGILKKICTNVGATCNSRDLLMVIE
jgi:biotin carboxyl carrier protein